MYKTGFTQKCIDLLKGKLAGEVKCLNLSEGQKLELAEFDNIVVGGGIYVGKLASKMKRFVKDNMIENSGKNIGVFVTSGENRKEYITENFSESIIKNAAAAEYFGGGMDTKKLSFIERTLLKIIGKCRDFEKIDENAIDRFAKAMNSAN